MEGKKHTILVIDDTPMQLQVLSLILMPTYDVRIAKEGKTGLELAHEYNIDLILLDIIMPDMSGYEVLEALKASDKTRAIPVICVTGSNAPEDKAKGLELGAADYVHKPFEKIDVLTRISAVLS